MATPNAQKLVAAIFIAAFALLAGVGVLRVKAQNNGQKKAEGQVRIARLVYANGKTSKCFAEGFLELADRKIDSQITRTLDAIELADSRIFEYPLVIMTGEGSFTLSEKEREQLKNFIDRGGFLLASAGCSSDAWARSFTREMTTLFPENEMAEMDTEHPLFHTLYDIDEIIAKKRGVRGAMFGLTIDDRLACVFSPLGLNDTGNAGRGCCCCGGNEVRNAKEINANIVTYALTH